MTRNPLRRWLRSALLPRAARRSATRARLGVETFERRDVPSSNIPLNGFTWTSLGPNPQVIGSTVVSGKATGVAIGPDPANPGGSRLFLASASGGVWRSTNDGATWTPLTDYQATLNNGS